MPEANERLLINLRRRLRKRLKRERRDGSYTHFRSKLVALGVSNREAWRFAALYFPPLDGSPLEADVIPPDLPPLPEELVKQIGKPPPKCELSMPSDKAYLYPVVDRSPEKMFNQRIRGAAYKPNDAAVKPDAFDVLFSRVPSGKSASQLAIIRWVEDNLLCNPALMNPLDVPSRGAVVLWKIARAEGVDSMATFFKEQWVKTLPSRSELDAAARFHDDGRKQSELEEAFIHSFQSADAP